MERTELDVQHYMDTLAGQLRLEWKLGLKDLQQCLLQIHSPEFTRPYPAMTLLQMTGMNAAIKAPAGIALQSTQEHEWQVHSIDERVLLPVIFEYQLEGREWKWKLTATHDCEFQLQDLIFTVVNSPVEALGFLSDLMTATIGFWIDQVRIPGTWRWNWRAAPELLLDYAHSPAILFQFFFDHPRLFALKAGKNIEARCHARKPFRGLSAQAIHVNVLPVQCTSSVPADPFITREDQLDYPLQFSKPGQLFAVTRVVAKNPLGESQLWIPYRGSRLAYTPHYWWSAEPRLNIIADLPLESRRVSIDAVLSRFDVRWVRSTFLSRSPLIPHFIQGQSLTKPTAERHPPWHSSSQTERALSSTLFQTPMTLIKENRWTEFLSHFFWDSDSELKIDVIRTQYRSIIEFGTLYRVLQLECRINSSALKTKEQIWLLSEVLRTVIEASLEPGLKCEIQVTTE